MIKRIVKVILAALALLVVAIVVFVLICVFERPGYTKTEISYGGVDFLVTSWGDWPHDTRYNWYHFDEGKNKLIFKGTANGHPSVEFTLQWNSDGVYYANLLGDYFCITGHEVILFEWHPIEHQKKLFTEYFHWILDTQGFWECEGISIGMFNWWSDPKAQAFLERVVREDPESDFFPKTVHDISFVKEYCAHSLEKKNPNQQVDPIVTTPVDEVEAQSTQGHP